MIKPTFFIVIILGTIAGPAVAAMQEHRAPLVHDATMDMTLNPDANFTLATAGNFHGQHDELVWNSLLRTTRTLTSLRPVSSITLFNSSTTSGETAGADESGHVLTDPVSYVNIDHLGFCVEANAVACASQQGWQAHSRDGIARFFLNTDSTGQNLILIGMANSNNLANSSYEWVPWKPINAIDSLATASNAPSAPAPLGRDVSAVPIPPAVWLFASALIGLGATERRRRVDPI